MAVTPVTPVAGLVSEVAVGGTPVTVFDALPNGGFITNPASNTDQGIANAESLYVNPVGAASLEANGTTFEILPGGTWEVIPGQTTTTTVNAVSDGHKFSAVKY